MKNPNRIKELDIELCKKYSNNPEKLEATIRDASFRWGKTRIGEDTNDSGSFYKYKIEIKYKGRELSFEFNDSIANKREGKSPSLYSILCCMKSEYNVARCCPVLDDFAKEFCEGMQISEIIQSHMGIMKFARDIGNVFTEDEIESFPS